MFFSKGKFLIEITTGTVIIALEPIDFNQILFSKSVVHKSVVQLTLQSQ